MLLKPIPSGKHKKVFRIYAICDDREACQVEEFFASLESNFHKSREKIFADMRKAAGDPRGAKALPSDRCHDMDKKDPIFEFTGGTGQLRVAWFYDENKLIICSHAFVKKKGQTPEAEKKIARVNRNKYFDAKKRGAIVFLPEDDGSEESK